MNTYALRQNEFDHPEAPNWTTVALPMRGAAVLLLKHMRAQYLLRRACRAGRIATRILIFLALGVTGLWAVVDLVKIIVDTFRGE